MQRIAHLPFTYLPANLTAGSAQLRVKPRHPQRRRQEPKSFKGCSTSISAVCAKALVRFCAQTRTCILARAEQGTVHRCWRASGRVLGPGGGGRPKAARSDGSASRCNFLQEAAPVPCTRRVVCHTNLLPIPLLFSPPSRSLPLCFLLCWIPCPIS